MAILTTNNSPLKPLLSIVDPTTKVIRNLTLVCEVMDPPITLKLISIMEQSIRLHQKHTTINQKQLDPIRIIWQTPWGVEQVVYGVALNNKGVDHVRKGDLFGGD